MFKKEGYAIDGQIKTLSKEEANVKLASPEILDRLEKHAKKVQALAPKSDDFLYFSIIFLKSAEAALIDESGETKKVGNDHAWGYFDDQWRWHGNVKPHRNNNGDIFPESELKIAARKWIGMPLCVDHKSDSVDGVRGIILDTYYDQKLKQVVGLCALDKVNYPDLARKVSTGVVRFGSMGTGVETSVCSECANQAKTQKDYCEHIKKRSAWGEVNVGLNPIEYSLVVQPAEPGARLLRCIASIKEHSVELENYGVDDIDMLVASLSINQAEDLERILASVCGETGCSIGTRKRIVESYLHSNGLLKVANLTPEQDIQVQFAEALAEVRKATGMSPDEEGAYEVYAPIYRAFGRNLDLPPAASLTNERFTSPEPSKSIVPEKGSDDVADYTGLSGNTSLTSGVTAPSDSFNESGGVGPESYISANKNFDSIIGEIMKESRLKKRAELRRRIAYFQNGTDKLEPDDFKSEPVDKYRAGDKHMHPNPATISDKGGMPGDLEEKEKLKRAELEARKSKIAYFQGGTDGVEPPTFKSEDYKKYWARDKHMHPNPATISDTGAMPGDEEIKKKLKRASLSTKLTKLRGADGSLNKAASKFEVFADGKLILATTAGEVFGTKLNENWDYMTSKDYGRDVVAEIRDSGLRKTAALLTKVAQDLPAAPDEVADPGLQEELPMDAGAEMPVDTPEDMGALDVGGDLGTDESLDAPADAKSRIESAFMTVEEALADARDALSALGADGDIDVNINVGGESDVPAEKVSLSSEVVKNLKNSVAELVTAADELSLIAKASTATLNKRQRQRVNALTNASISDSLTLAGETKAFVSVAKNIAKSLVKNAEDEFEVFEESSEDATASDDDAPLSAEEAKMIEEIACLMYKTDPNAANPFKSGDKFDAWERGVEEAHSKDLAADKEDESYVDQFRKVDREFMDNSADDGDTDELVAEAKLLRRKRREQILRKAQLMGGQSAGSVVENSALDATPERLDLDIPEMDNLSVGDVDTTLDPASVGIEAEPFVREVAKEESDIAVDDHVEEMHMAPSIASKLQDSFVQKRAQEIVESEKIKIRRAYDVASKMQSKRLIPNTKAALNSQVDRIMEFDDKAFESFKRSIDAINTPKVATASSLGDVNIGLQDEPTAPVVTNWREALKNIW